MSEIWTVPSWGKMRGYVIFYLLQIEKYLYCGVDVLKGPSKNFLIWNFKGTREGGKSFRLFLKTSGYRH